MIMEKEMHFVICSVGSVHMEITESKIRLAGIFAVYLEQNEDGLEPIP